jgi:hypothetical protein
MCKLFKLSGAQHPFEAPCVSVPVPSKLRQQCHVVSRRAPHIKHVRNLVKLWTPGTYSFTAYLSQNDKLHYKESEFSEHLTQDRIIRV